MFFSHISKYVHARDNKLYPLEKSRPVGRGGAQGAHAPPVFWEKRLLKSFKNFPENDLYINVHPQILAPRYGPEDAVNF